MDGTVPVYPNDPTLIARTSAGCGDRKYGATEPFLKLVEPVADQKVANTEVVRVR